MDRRDLLRLSGATIASGLGFKNAVAQEAPTIRLLTDASVGVPFPVPKPMSKDDILPQNSNDIVIATGNAEFFYMLLAAIGRFQHLTGSHRRFLLVYNSRTRCFGKTLIASM
jgi:hypothetical protein